MITKCECKIVSFRLLAFDYDGTVAEDGALPNARVREAVAAAQAAGVRVVLATGRPYASARGYAAALGLYDPVICMQGAMVQALAGDRPVLWTEPLPKEPLREVLAFAEQRDLDLNLYAEIALYHVAMHYPQAFYDRWFGMPMVRVDSFDEACRRLAAQGQHPLKGLFISEPDASGPLLIELEERFGDRLTVVQSHPLFVEVTSPRASKGQALAFLADYFGIAQADILAAGDSGNDISMIQWAGWGVAMGNATADVRAAADWIAPPVSEDGLADVIERFVLQNGK